MRRTGIQVWLGGVFRLAEVKLQEGECIENALRRFKRKVQQEDIIKEVKRLLLPEAGREKARKGSFGAQTQSQEGTERTGLVIHWAAPSPSGPFLSPSRSAVLHSSNHVHTRAWRAESMGLFPSAV